MISFEDAFRIVMSHLPDLGTEFIPLTEATGRILAETVETDRDLPPFDRVTMDGIAICYDSYANGRNTFPVSGEARAGSPKQSLQDPGSCVEVMTGAVVPEGADTVIRYEDVEIHSGVAKITGSVKRGQSIHLKGSDAPKATRILDSGTRIGPAEVSVLASVGKSTVAVGKLPKITVISTGDELVEIDADPLPHQIRRSNVYALQSALKFVGVSPELSHLPDREEVIQQGLKSALSKSDAVLISGGVSMGKYDYLPDILMALGVTRHFHRVAQKPGKPFWFGSHKDSGCGVFSFPGNPVSTFLNYHVYFREWLWRSWGIEKDIPEVALGETLQNPGSLTRFYPGKVVQQDSGLVAQPVQMNGSGDFISLSRADGFIHLESGAASIPKGTLCSFFFFNSFGQ